MHHVQESLHEQIFTHDERITTVPHLLNLNEDHMLSKLVRYYIEKGLIKKKLRLHIFYKKPYQNLMSYFQKIYLSR